MQARCLIEFGKEYDNNYKPEYIDDLEYAQSYEHDEEQPFFVLHVDKLSWADENKKAQERLEKKQQLEKRNTQKTTEKTEKTEQVDFFGKFFGGN